jgi:hypothetical protein
VWREQLTVMPNGLRLPIPHGKRTEACAVSVVGASLQASDCRSGPVYRKGDR